MPADLASVKADVSDLDFKKSFFGRFYSIKCGERAIAVRRNPHKIRPPLTGVQAELEVL